MFCNQLCFKFVLAAIMSVGTTIFACTMLIIDKFQNTAITSFCTGIIGMNLGYWCDSPKAIDKNYKSPNSDIIP